MCIRDSFKGKDDVHMKARRETTDKPTQISNKQSKIKQSLFADKFDIMCNSIVYVILNLSRYIHVMLF